ncbi:hypothetical protein VTI74DRAFT_1069 [Chaetomium olivicolor]
MPTVTILGAGITGLSIASLLPKDTYTITIVARDLPGEPDSLRSQGWASPWACAGWVALGGHNAREDAMLFASLAHLRQLAAEHPESGARCVTLEDEHAPEIAGSGKADGVCGWFRDEVPRFMVVHEGDGEKRGVRVRYGSVVVNPNVFLPWMRRRLENEGVRFERIGTVQSLGEMSARGQDVLVNAAGAGVLGLKDVRDGDLFVDRTYVTVVRSGFEGAFVRRGESAYTYIFGRGNGTAVVGGVSEPVEEEAKSWEVIHKDLFHRAHEYLPEHFPSSNPADYEVIENLVGVRPLREPRVRVEKEILDGQKVVHAYGTTAGGYMYSFGLAKKVVRLVEEVVAGKMDHSDTEEEDYENLKLL